MVSGEKMSAEKRRETILAAATQLFAEAGFSGTTTRAVAEAAGVSEALLFKHFPNKEVLYSETKLCCIEDARVFEAIIEGPASDETPVLMVFSIINRIVNGPRKFQEEHTALKRLVIRSLLEGSPFASEFLKSRSSAWLPVLQKSMKHAVEAGTLKPLPGQSLNAFWFAHHLAVAISLFLMPSTPAVDYGVDKNTLVNQAVWFALRGIGFEDKFIAMHLTPEKIQRYDEFLEPKD